MKTKSAMVAAVVLAGVFALPVTACGDKSYNENVESLEWIEFITGPNSRNKTDETFGVGGTDLGFPIYNSKNDTMYLAFGDTFMDAKTQSGLWRSNVMAYTKDFDLSDGLTLDGFLSGGSNAAKAIIDGHHLTEYEITKIPTGGIEVNGVMYMFYFSRFVAGGTSPSAMNYGGAVKSEDNGETWERVNDLTWLDDYVPERKADNEKLANEDINMNPTDAGITMESHVGYSFTQSFPVDGKDGYVYLLGEGGYRTGGMKLARVAYAEIEKFESYEYLKKLDESGNPVWLKGSEGLKTIDKDDGAYVIDKPSFEHCAMYNAYLKKWMVMNVQEGGGSGWKDRDIVYRTADHLWGPYSESKTLVGEYPFLEETGKEGVYGGFCHEKWTEDGGKTIYFTVSEWKPVYNVSIMKAVLK